MKYNNSSIVDAINIAINEAENKEKEYNRINKLDDNKVKNSWK